jgi:cobalt/nickel transport protein
MHRILTRANCAWVTLLTLALSSTASAHFQLIYTPDMALKNGAAIEMVLLFTHPFEAGHTMDMGAPAEFYVMSQRGSEAKPQKTDLQSYLEKITWTSLTNSGQAYRAQLPRTVTRSLGDYVFVLVPAPYLEGSEDKYIQQYTKMVMNVGGLPGNWGEPVGLPTEIIPLDKPYANWVGGVFRGVVLADGKPVPNAELEIGYVNHALDLSARKFAGAANATAPQDSFNNLGIRTNDRGEFTIGLPKAGWWGICALGSGPQKQHQGKALSQDAVIWVKATDMR